MKEIKPGALIPPLKYREYRGRVPKKCIGCGAFVGVTRDCLVGYEIGVGKRIAPCCKRRSRSKR